MTDDEAMAAADAAVACGLIRGNESDECALPCDLLPVGPSAIVRVQGFMMPAPGRQR